MKLNTFHWIITIILAVSALFNYAGQQIEKRNLRQLVVNCQVSTDVAVSALELLPEFEKQQWAIRYHQVASEPTLQDIHRKLVRQRTVYTLQRFLGFDEQRYNGRYDYMLFINPRYDPYSCDADQVVNEFYEATRTGNSVSEIMDDLAQLGNMNCLAVRRLFFEQLQRWEKEFDRTGHYQISGHERYNRTREVVELLTAGI